MSLLSSLKQKASDIKKKTAVLYIALQSPDTGLPAKIMAVITIAYAMSPVDLIPDFIPVLGLLDDLILLPLFIMLTIKLIPEHVLAEAEKQADENPPELKKNKAAAAVIILLWAALITMLILKIIS